jgi:hypothetical protein
VTTGIRKKKKKKKKKNLYFQHLTLSGTWKFITTTICHHPFQKRKKQDGVHAVGRMMVKTRTRRLLEVVGVAKGELVVVLVLVVVDAHGDSHEWNCPKKQM